MTPTNRPNGSFAVHAALALGFLLAAAGCVTPKPVYKPDAREAPATYKFTIGFTGANGCPTASSVRSDFANCNAALPPNAPDDAQPKDCARAKYNQTVAFESNPAGKPFQLQFDPFGKSSLSVDGATGALPFAAARDKAQSTSRTYTFRVAAPNCPPVDPQIIIDW